MTLNPMDEPNRPYLLKMFELGANQYLSDEQRETAILALGSLSAGATIRDFCEALDLTGSMVQFSEAVRRCFLHECVSYKPMPEACHD